LHVSGPPFDTSVTPIRRPAATLASLALLLAAARTSEPDLPGLRNVDIPSATAEASEVAPEPAEPAPAVPSEVGTLGGRLAVLDEGGNLVTTDPHASREVVLAGVEPGLSEARQPSWSRDGGRLAWVHLQVTEAGTLAAGVATSTDRARSRRSRERWSPRSTRRGTRRRRGSPTSAPRAGGEIELGILEIAGHNSGSALDTGQPFYLSWGPTGDELLVHVGTERLETLDLDGKLTTVAQRPGAFGAPVWTADGRTFVYASTRAGGQQLVVQHADADRGRSVLPFEGLITFVVSPDGGRIAFEAFEGGDARPLTVLDVASGETTEVTDQPVAAFSWSPNVERLLYLDPDPAQDQVWFRWGVWDGRRVFTTPRFIPSQRMIDEYLPFFEQYAQSMSLWSPDGSAFAYPGMSENGDTGIWIQSARSDRAPVLVSDGDLVAWSPA
jgi:TolB protein